MHRYRLWLLGCSLALLACGGPRNGNNNGNGPNGNPLPTQCQPNSADQVGCTCPAVGATQGCWPGDPAKRNAGSCHDGTQTCLSQAEFVVWGPCTGANTAACGGGAPTGGCGAVEFATCDGGTPAPTPPPSTGGCGSGEFVQCDGGTSGTCTQPVNGRCPDGDFFDKSQHLCCPCDATTCNHAACCAQPACAGAQSCTMCNNATLDPACGGTVDTDCDDFPEDCDQLCCPCKPGVCTACPMGQIPCNGVCVNAYNDPTHCGACDHVCKGSQQCTHGVCS